MAVVDISVPGSDGTLLSVRVHGHEPRALLVHGLASNARLWDGMAGSLRSHGWGAVAVDQRGHGRSAKPGTGFDFPTLADDLAAVVGAWGGGPMVAIGQSWGGNVVLEFAARHPHLVSAVVCVDGGFIRLADGFEGKAAMLDALAPPRFDGLRSADLEAGLRARLEGWPESGILGQLANFEESPDGTIGARLGRHDHLTILGHLWDHDPDALADRIDAPILVVAVPGGIGAKGDRVAAFAAAHPAATVVWLEGDHDIHAQHPDLVARAVVEFAGAR